LPASHRAIVHLQPGFHRTSHRHQIFQSHRIRHHPRESRQNLHSAHLGCRWPPSIHGIPELSTGSSVDILQLLDAAIFYTLVLVLTTGVLYPILAFTEVDTKLMEIAFDEAIVDI
jgi:hypothetical protein